jgi:hypothetical protein
MPSTFIRTINPSRKSAHFPSELERMKPDAKLSHSGALTTDDSTDDSQIADRSVDGYTRKLVKHNNLVN